MFPTLNFGQIRNIQLNLMLDDPTDDNDYDEVDGDVDYCLCILTFELRGGTSLTS